EDRYDPIAIKPHIYSAVPVAGLALLPGLSDGEVEAWAALNSETDSSFSTPALVHYSSDPPETALSGGGARAKPLPDAPAPRAGEISLAAFGKSDCFFGNRATCDPMLGRNYFSDIEAQRVRDAIVGAQRAGGGPAFALFTGDVNDGAGDQSHGIPRSVTAALPSDAHSAKLGTWNELVGQRLADAGVPLFGAVGGQDVSEAAACVQTLYTCASTRSASAGLNLPWRAAFASMFSPWGGPGHGGPPGCGGPSF